MRAIRAIALTAALVMALLSASATSAVAAKDNANGYAVSSQGTLSFHAAQGGKGGFIFTPTGEGSFSGKVTCYSQTGVSATFVGVVTKSSNSDVQVGDSVQFNLRDNPGSMADETLYTEDGQACAVNNNLDLNDVTEGNIKIAS